MTATTRPDSIILSVRLRSGAFESSIEMPVCDDRAAMDTFVKHWLELMETALVLSKAKEEQ